MTYNCFLQLLRLHGLPSEFSRVVVEVIVRTPRLLSTVKQKYASEPFNAQTANGVTLQWSQTKASKAYVRLQLLPGEAATQPASATSGVATAAAQAATAATPQDGSPSIRTSCKSGEGLLQLGEPGQLAQMHLVLSQPLEPEGGTGGGGAERATGGGGGSAVAAVDVELLVQFDRSGGAVAAAAVDGGERGGSTAAASGPLVPGPGATNGTSSAGQIWAWAEVASSQSAPPPAGPVQLAAPRKRSWLLALGLGRHGSGSPAAGGGAAARTGAGNNAVASLAGGDAAAPLRDASSKATSGWDPVAALSSVTTTSTSTTTAATAATATGTTAATVSSLSLTGSGNMTAIPYGPQEGTAEYVSRGAGRRRLPPAPGAAPLPGSAAGPPPPRLPASLFDQSSLAGPATATNTAVGAVPAATAAAAGGGGGTNSPPPQQQQPQAQATFMTSAPSGSSEPKRRRLGDFFSKLFHPTSLSNTQIRRIGGVEASASSVGHVASHAAMVTDLPTAAAAAAAAGTPAAAAAAAAPPTAAPAQPSTRPPLRRYGSLLGVTPLTPPSPRLGDVYRVQDNALASDAGVQIGFGASGAPRGASGDIATVVASASAAELRPSSVLLPGLESPGYGETSPAGGPDRLTLEPPVSDLAAASLASPMATSPVTQAGGCFFWRYGAAARARAAAQLAEGAVVVPSAAVGLGRAGSAPVPGAAAAGAAAPPLATLSAAAALPAAMSSSGPGHGCADKPDGQASGATQQQPRQQAGAQAQGAGQGRSAGQGQAPGGTAEAELDPWSHRLEGEISRVVEFVTGQAGSDEDLKVLALSQCQFLLDCLRNPEMCWLVGDSLLQLKHEVGFPFDTGVAIAGAPGWFRLVIHPLHPPPPPPAVAASSDGTGADGSHAAAVATAAVVLPPHPEVLKVRWAAIDQRQAGGTNACAAISLETAAWCLSAVQRWRQAISAAVAAASGAGGGGGGRRDSAVWPQPLPVLGPHPEQSSCGSSGGGCRRELAPALSRSQRDRERERVVSSIELEAMTGAALEQCIQAGTAVWQAVLVQSPAARVASSTGDFDLEHMLQLGGYSQRLRLAEYLAASMLMDDGGSGGAVAAPRRCSLEVSVREAVPAGPAAAPAPAADGKATAATAAAASVTPTVLPSTAPLAGRPPRPPALQLAVSSSDPPLQCGVGPVVALAAGEHPPPAPMLSTRARQASQCELPTFSALVRSLHQGVYVMGWRGHFATLWLRPGGVVHLIDSLGARLAADCPLAFVLEFDCPADFLEFFLARHQAQREAAAADDIAGANMAALIEVHRLELAQPHQLLQPQLHPR